MARHRPAPTLNFYRAGRIGSPRAPECPADTFASGLRPTPPPLTRPPFTPDGRRKTGELAVIDPYISLGRRGTWAALKLAEVGISCPADDPLPSRSA